MTVARGLRAAPLAALLALAPSVADAENVPAERLLGLSDLMPAAPQGFVRQSRLGTYSSPAASSATTTYETEDGRAFDIVVTFSADNVRQNRDIMKDKSQRDLFGVDAVKVKGRDGLARRAGNKNASVAVYLVVLTDSRILAVTDPFGTTEAAVLKAALEAADLDLIARR